MEKRIAPFRRQGDRTSVVPEDYGVRYRVALRASGAEAAPGCLASGERAGWGLAAIGAGVATLCRSVPAAVSDGGGLQAVEVVAREACGAGARHLWVQGAVQHAGSSQVPPLCTVGCHPPVQRVSTAEELRP